MDETRKTTGIMPVVFFCNADKRALTASRANVRGPQPTIPVFSIDKKYTARLIFDYESFCIQMSCMRISIFSYNKLFYLKCVYLIGRTVYFVTNPLTAYEPCRHRAISFSHWSSYVSTWLKQQESLFHTCQSRWQADFAPCFHSLATAFSSSRRSESRRTSILF